MHDHKTQNKVIIANAKRFEAIKNLRGSVVKEAHELSITI